MKMYKRTAALAAALILMAGLSVSAQDGSFEDVTMENGTVSENFTVEGDLTVGDTNVADSIAKIQEDIGQNEENIRKNKVDIEQNRLEMNKNRQVIREHEEAIIKHEEAIGQERKEREGMDGLLNESITQEAQNRQNADSQLNKAIENNAANIEKNSHAISSLNNRVSDLSGEIDNVGAISAALAGLHPLGYNGTGSKVQIAAAMGDYDGKQAVAFGGFYHFNQDMMMSVGGATTFDGDQKTAYNVGLSVRVGQGSSKKADVNEDIMALIASMNEKIAALEAENKELSGKDTALEAEEAK